MELPDSVWAGNQIGPLAKEHFQRRSDLAGSMCRNLVEIPYVKRGPEVPAVHGGMSMTQQNPNRGADPVGEAMAKGYTAIGSEDEIGFAGPSGRAYELASKSCAELRDEIFGAMNTMALCLANTSEAVGRSGLSKREDRSATLVIQDFLGTRVRETAAEVYEVVADGRGEEGTAWIAAGADSYDDDDRSELVGEATEVEMLTIPSPTFKRKYATKLALALVPKLSPVEKKAIEDELQANITDESVLPPPPPVAGAGAPGSGGMGGTFTNQPKPPAAPAKPPAPGKGTTP
jgi:hypothetical protein